MNSLIFLLVVFSPLINGLCYPRFPDPLRPDSGEYLLGLQQECNCQHECQAICSTIFEDKIITGVEWYEKFGPNKYCHVTMLTSVLVEYSCDCPQNFTDKIYIDSILRIYTIDKPQTLSPATLTPISNHKKDMVIVISLIITAFFVLVIGIISIIYIIRCWSTHKYTYQSL